MTNTRKIGPSRAATMTESEISRAIFRGASTTEPRGLSDAFSDAAIVAIANSETAGTWRESAWRWLAS